MTIQEKTEQILGGHMSALRTYIEFKKELKDLEAAAEAIKTLAISEAQNYPEKAFKMAGAVVEKKNAPAQWDYSECEAFLHAKNRLNYIQKVAQAGGGADTETGEVIGRAVKIEGALTISLKFDATTP